MALNGTMELIDSVTVPSGGQAAFDFINIPQTYDDLVIMFSVRSANSGTSGGSATMRFNNDSGSNYSFRWIRGDGANATSNSASTTFIRVINNSPTAGNTASTFCNSQVYIPNYRGSVAKSVSEDNVSENNTTTAYSFLVAGLWTGTAAINRVTVTGEAGNFAEHSTATLYGISKVPAIAKAYGGEIAFDDQYVYHAFKASGTFTPLENLTVDYLVVAGGGGAGGENRNTAGGGAGGLRCTVTATGGGGSLESPLSLTANTNYTVTIGAGAAAVSTTVGNDGSNSTFSTITSTGGGGGGAYETNGRTGGSGGGAGTTEKTGNNYSPGTGTTNQGYSGGQELVGGDRAGGGGGGAGAVGGNASTNTGGAGGNGVQITALANATGTGADNGYYAGGGAGGSRNGTETVAGGLGGGGKFVALTTAYSGAVNTGGGGGAQTTSGVAAGAGGSGIVIVRYAR